MTKKIGMGKDYEHKENLMQNTLQHLKSFVHELKTEQDLLSAAREFLHSQEAEEEDKEMVLIALRAIPLSVLKQF